MPPRRLDPAQLPPERALARRLAARGPQRPITVVHDGDSVPALEGESLALSLLVAGRETLSRSAKYHRPRGAMCLRGHCEGCLLRVDGNPNAMACRTPARPGMVATSQNAFPHARLDVFRVTDWFFPKHLDHHGLMVGLGETVNRTMQSVARKMAGLGTLPDAAAPVQPAHVHQMDALVVGGGSAGVAAANALVAEGFSVMLCDRERSLGGARRDDPSDPLDDLEALHPDVMCLVDATAVATYDNGTLVVQGDALHQVRARVRVLACGTVDTVGTFVHNDLPGVYTARAFARALCAGVLLADRVALVGPTPTTPGLASVLGDLGLHSLHVAPDATVEAALGSRSVEGVTLQDAGTSRTLRPLDALVVGAEPVAAYELAGQAGAGIVWDARRQCFTPSCDEDGATAGPGVYVTGSLRLGLVPVAERREDGRRVARAAADHLRKATAP